jgi:hypothetical protein
MMVTVVVLLGFSVRFGSLQNFPDPKPLVRFGSGNFPNPALNLGFGATWVRFRFR